MASHAAAQTSTAELLTELRRPDTWPLPCRTPVELIETHISWVLRGEGDVFKVKKPVALGFLDFSSVDRRRAACEEEVRLNSRLAPGVYRGAVPVARQRDGTVVFRPDEIGGRPLPHPAGRVARELWGNGNRLPQAGRTASGDEIVDWAVWMARLPDAARADTLLAQGTLTVDHLGAIACTMADLHAHSVVDPASAARFASAAAIERNVRENFDQIRDKAGDMVDDWVTREVERRQTDFVRERAALLDARTATRICDGHGDLRLEHVYVLPQGLRIIDCIEFDARYRIADACADVAFLAMDLTSLGHTDLAERFLGRYARATQDYDLYALIDFYESYRAWVRGKVSAMLAEDTGAGESVRARASRAARSHFLLALAYERPPIVTPTLVCVGGIVASGKSTVADALADELACPVVDSDRTRRHLLGGSESDRREDPAWTGAYDPAITDRVYAEVLRRASVVLSSGRTVVIDASFRASAERHRARELARSRGAEFRFVQCQAPIEICRARLERRRSGPSDAHSSMFDGFVTSFERVSDLPASEVIDLDTTDPPRRSIELLRDWVARWPRGLR